MKRTVLIAILMTSAFASCSRPETVTPSTESRGDSGVKATSPPPADADLPAITGEEMLAERLLGYSAPALDGSTYSIAEHRGKVVLVNAWATWCGPCRYEIPELKRLHEQYAGAGLEIVGVSVDMAPAEPSVRQFAQVNSIPYPILLDPQSRLTMMLRTTSIPTSVLLDRQGKIVWRHIGIISEQRDQSFRDALSKALGS